MEKVGLNILTSSYPEPEVELSFLMFIYNFIETLKIELK